MFSKNNQSFQILLLVAACLVLLSLACGLGSDSETETPSETSESQTAVSAPTLEATEPPDTSTSSADAPYQQGLDHYEEGDYEEAITAFSEAIKLDSNYALAYHERGMVYQDLGEHEKAIVDFTQAIELEHDPLSWPYNSRGMSHLALGDNEQAIADFNQAIELDPNYANAYNNRGLIHQFLGDTKQALADYNQAIELDPEHAKAYGNRGWLHTDLGEHEQAIADLTTAIELDPNNSSAFRNRGRAYYGVGNTEQAIADLTTAIELDPEDALAYSNRGFAYSQIDEYEQAITDLTTAIELNPNFAQAYLNRAVAYQGAGNPNEAIVDLETYLELQPDSPKRDQVEALISELMAEASVTAEQAEDLPPGNSIRVDDNVSAEKGDTFAILGTAGSKFVISVEPEPGLDMAIEIHDMKSGDIVATANESSGQEMLSFEVPTDIRSGLYRVLVGSVNGVSGKYTALLIGTSGIAFGLQPNYFVAGRLPEDGVLSYTYTGPGGQNLRAMVVPHPDTKVDLILTVHSLSDLETPLLEANETGNGEDEEFSLILPEEGTGTYIISVKEANKQAGKYLLGIELETSE